jgi:hypothetical protein
MEKLRDDVDGLHVRTPLSLIQLKHMDGGHEDVYRCRRTNCEQ